MDDKDIVELYWNRDEKAVEVTAEKYGRYCHSIAGRILGDPLDVEECVNDTYQSAWNSIPPHRPENLSAYLGKLTRRISLKRWRYRDAEKRGGGEPALSLEELKDCIPTRNSLDEKMDAMVLADVINSFLAELPETERRVFVRRYFHGCSIREICRQFGFSKSKVESMLYRTRNKLRNTLEEVYF